MKTADKSAMTKRNFDELISKFSKEEILNVYAMQSVKGGDGDGGADIILFPPKPPQP
jgi:hypothetical protein